MNPLQRLGLLVGVSVAMTAFGKSERMIQVQLMVPDAAWTIAIEEVRQVNDEIWVLSKLTRAQGMMGAQVISQKKAELKLETPDLPVKHLILGKTWKWTNREPYTFLKDSVELEKPFRTGTLLYPRKPSAPPKPLPEPDPRRPRLFRNP